MFWSDELSAFASCYSTPDPFPNSTISPLINKDKWSIALLFLLLCGAKRKITVSEKREKFMTASASKEDTNRCMKCGEKLGRVGEKKQ